MFFRLPTNMWDKKQKQKMLPDTINTIDTFVLKEKEQRECAYVSLHPLYL